MTIGGVNCNAQVLLNELTCRIPKGLVIPREGLPVRVRMSALKPLLEYIRPSHIKTSNMNNPLSFFATKGVCE